MCIVVGKFTCAHIQGVTKTNVKPETGDRPSYDMIVIKKI